MASLDLLSSRNEAHVSATSKAFGITIQEFHELHRQAVEAKSKAYCPYSNFHVGSALLVAPESASAFPSGVLPIVQGANVENASYPVGTCAERVGIGHALMMGHRSYRAIAVATDITPPTSPCGMCRQFIREFVTTDFPVIMFDKNGDYIALKLESLLPLSFGPDALAKHQEGARASQAA